MRESAGGCAASFSRTLLLGGLLCAAALVPQPTRAAPETQPASAAPSFPNRIEIPTRSRPDTLSPDEEEKGWRLLFDGKDTRAWRSVAGDTFPEDGWEVRDGVLTIRAAGPFEFRAGGDLLSRERFGSFVFDFEFQLSQGANSGIKYFAEVQKQWFFVHSLGCEFQLLDDAQHPDARRGHNGNRTLASLYDLIAADAGEFTPGAEPKSFYGIGKWNHGRIHVENRHVAHYLNGEKVLSTKIGSESWRRALKTSKFADRPAFCDGKAGRGHLVLQDHGDTVHFRNLRILPLD